MDEKEKIAVSSEAVCQGNKIAMEHKREETNGEQTVNVIETECPDEKIEKKNNDVTVREADDEKLLEHCTQTDGEAGPIVFHVGHDMNEKELTDSASGAVCYEEEITMACKREEADEAAAAAAAKKKTLESNDAISKEDVDIRRLIEERRSTSKGEKQRLKDLSKKMHQGQEKSKMTRGDSTNTRRLQKGSGTFQESDLQEEEYSSPR